MTHFYLLWLQRQPSKYKLSVITAPMPAEKMLQCCCHCGKEKYTHYERWSVRDNKLFFPSTLPLPTDLHVRDSWTISANSREVCLLEG